MTSSFFRLCAALPLLTACSSTDERDLYAPDSASASSTGSAAATPAVGPALAMDAGALLLDAGTPIQTMAGRADNLPVVDASGPRSELSDKAQLGQALFEDVRLSEPAGLACASCHDATQAFTGNAKSDIPGVSRGSRPGVLGTRNAPSAMYASFSPKFGFVLSGEDDPEEGEAAELIAQGGQFWDGRARDLVEQAEGPLLNAREMNNPNKAAVVEKLKDAPYRALWDAVYGAASLDSVETAYDLLGEAIAAFEGTARFHPFSSKFDDVLRGKATFTDAEQRGFALFKDPKSGNCIACHAGNPQSTDPTEWLFTDFTYDNLGIPRNSQIPDNADATRFDLGLCQQAGLAAKLPPSVSLDSLCGAFKVPTLRNIAITAPYGHNGYFAQLKDVVSFYATRDTNPERWYPVGADGGVAKFDDLPTAYHANVNREEVPYDRKPGEAPRLNETQISDLVAFLQTLTDR